MFSCTTLGIQTKLNQITWPNPTSQETNRPSRWKLLNTKLGDTRKKWKRWFFVTLPFTWVVLKLQCKSHLWCMVKCGFPGPTLENLISKFRSQAQNCILNKHLKWFCGTWTLGHTFKSYRENYQECVCWGDLHLQYHDVNSLIYSQALESVVGEGINEICRNGSFSFLFKFK